jgi:hypothetical protein
MISTTDIDFRAAQQTLWGDAGVWAYDHWHDLNDEFFNSELNYVGIVWGLTPHGGNLGHCYDDGRITLHSSLLDPRSTSPWGKEAATWTDLYARDVLLHEMIHQLLYARGVDSKHNGLPWCAEIKRLSPLLLGIEIVCEPVKPRRVEGKVKRLARDGCLSRDAIARWPHTIRPNAGTYYRGGRQLRVRL